MKKRFFVYIFTVCAIIGGSHLTLASASDLKRVAFPEVKGWKPSGDPQAFSSDDLYQYIDGGADLYLTYDFQDLEVLEYEGEKEATVTVEVYRHKTPYDAFGVYSQERPPAPEVLAVGAQGTLGEDYLNFVAGAYYVKISAYQTGAEGREVLILFAKKLAETLGDKTELPSLLKSFPEEGKIRNSEKFVAKKFMGYSFLHTSFTAEYVAGANKFLVFIIECGNRNEAGNMIETYLRQNGKAVKDVAEGRFVLSDPHHGEIALSWKGTRVWGTMGLADPALQSKYLKLVEETLPEAK